DDTPSGTASDTYPINVTIADDDLGTTTLGGHSATVNNVAPTITSFTLNGVATAISINEAQSVTVDGSFTDPAFGVSTETFTAFVDWGNGTSTPATISGGSFTATYTYADDTPSGTPSDTYAIAVTITDDDTGTMTLGGRSVTVNNV